MKRYVFYVMVFFYAVLGRPSTASATHIIGGELFYTLVSGNTYTITLIMYGDCVATNFPTLSGNTPTIRIYNNNFEQDTLALSLVGTPIEISPVCPAQVTSTTCYNIANPIIGIKKFVYQANYTLPTTSANWLFRFSGALGYSPVTTLNYVAGRSAAITNVVGVNSTNGSIMALEARLNNQSFSSNNSPTYTTIPTPFFCVNKAANYNPGAVDANNDSLVFSLVPGLTDVGGVVSYVPGYSATSPLTVAAGSFSFSTSNGQLAFTPSTVQTSMVVYQIDEYRNGILVGSSMREMNFVVLSSCNNAAPTGGVISAAGGIINPGGTGTSSCFGQSAVSFVVNVTDVNNDHVTVSAAGVPAGAVLTISNNNTTNPTVNFSWNIANVPNGTYTFYLTYVDDGCPLSSNQTIAYDVSIYSPSAPVVTNLSYCTGSIAAPLTAAGQNLKWYSTAMGGTPFFTTPTPPTTAAGTQTYYVSQSLAACESARTPLTVTVLPKPAPPVATPDSVTYCQGYTALPLSAIGTSLLYYHPPSNLGVASLTPSTLITGLDSFYVTQQLSGCVSDKAKIKVRTLVAPVPVVPDTFYTYCQYEVPIALSATGTAVKWYTTAVGGTAASSPPVISTAIAGTFVYYVTQTNSNGCESVRKPITVIVKPQPTIPGVVNLYYCVNTVATQLTAAGQNILWYSAPTGGTGISAAPVPSTTAIGVQTYYVSQTINGCEGPRTSLTVTVSPYPAAPVATPDSITYCEGHQAVPLTAIGLGLLYYHPITSIGVPSLTPSTVIVGIDSYFVTQTVNGCISGKTRIKVRTLLAPTPAADTLYTYCQYETAVALSATGTLIKWYTTATGGTPSATPPVPVTFLAGTFTYYVTQTLANGCESIRLPIKVLVKPKPAPPTVVTPVRYCQYAAATHLTASVGSNLKWYDVASGGLGSSVAPVPNTNYVDTTSYWVTQTINGCESDRSLIKVIVNFKPNGIILSKKPFVCQYDTDTLYYYGSAAPGYTVDWKIPAIDGEIIDSIGRDTIVVRFDSAGTIPIRMQVNNNGCLSDEFIYHVDVRPLPIVRIAAAKDVCTDQVTQVALDRSYVPNVDHYIWNFDGGNSPYGVAMGGPYGVSWASSGFKTISVTATRLQCSRTYTDTILVHDPPQTVIKADYNNSFCAGDTATVEAVIPTDSIAVYKIRWSPAEMFRFGYGFDSTAYKTLAIVTSSTPITLSLTDRYGCVGKNAFGIDVKPCCEVSLPTAFTPNGDGLNDLFRIRTVGHHEISSFRIVNRWGQTVFETANELEGWNGNFGGKPQEADVYFYYLRYRCETGIYSEKKGELTLVR